MVAKTKNFNPEIDLMLKCSATGKCEIKQWALDKLQSIRDDYKKPMVINSGYRDPSHPVEAKKKQGGQHTKGVAFDIAIYSSVDAFRLVELAIKHGASGIGVSQSFIHIDFRDSKQVLWTY